jgi:hypothetical protein
MFPSLFEIWSFSENPWARDAWLDFPPASAHDNGGQFLQFSTVQILTGEISVSDVRSTWVRTGFSFFLSTLLGLTDAGTEQTVWNAFLCLNKAISHSLLWTYCWVNTTRCTNRFTTKRSCRTLPSHRTYTRTPKPNKPVDPQLATHQQLQVHATRTENC